MRKPPTAFRFRLRAHGGDSRVRIVAKTAWRVLFPPTQCAPPGRKVAAPIREAHPLAPLLVLVWMPIRTLGTLGYRTCVQIEVALR